VKLRRPALWSLQRRLVVGILALLALVSVVVGTVSVVALHQDLMTRLDNQVRQAVGFESGQAQPPSGGPGRRVGSLIYARDAAGNAVGQYTDERGATIPLTAGQRAKIEAIDASDGTPVTVDLGGRLGSFRVAVVHSATGAELAVGQSLNEVTTTTANLVLIFALVTLVALLAAGIATAIIVRTALRPLGRVADTATRVAELPLEKGEVALERVPDADTDTRTEVGQVGAAFHRMLGHVEQALVAREASENKVRQFVADASHELRTPLASIRGYSELTRRGGHELPPDVVRALGRIESESVRMTSLVEDLLLLARLDAGRELVLGDVDLVPIVADAVADAHAAGPGHEWTLEVQRAGATAPVPAERQLAAGAAASPADTAPVVVQGDGSRLHQVVGNLLANARTHTPDGSHVDIRLAVEGDSAVLTVADDGPGIPEELQPVLFERFARGDNSRSRATGSTGLGLAIVAAVVEAHHGTVEARSRPGDTRFTVRLPLRRG
jgi:two-component system OmpR family sensor kinase